MNSPVPRHVFQFDVETTSNSVSLREMKARQSRKIEELRKALCAGGPVSFSDQGELLGLCRSTAWAVLKRPYKNSGLTAAVVNRILASQKLPSPARRIILEYIAEKGGGLYGHSRLQRRRFISRLSSEANDNCMRTRGEMPEPLSPDSVAQTKNSVQSGRSERLIRVTAPSHARFSSSG